MEDTRYESGSVYGKPARDIFGYGSSPPDPQWPGGVSGKPSYIHHMLVIEVAVNDVRRQRR